MSMWPAVRWFSFWGTFMGLDLLRDSHKREKVRVCVCVSVRIVVMGIWRPWKNWIAKLRQRYWKEGMRWQVKGNLERLWCWWNHIPRWLMAASWRACAQRQSFSRQWWVGAKYLRKSLTAGAAQDKTSDCPSGLTHTGLSWLRLALAHQTEAWKPLGLNPIKVYLG